MVTALGSCVKRPSVSNEIKERGLLSYDLIRTNEMVKGLREGGRRVLSGYFFTVRCQS